MSEQREFSRVVRLLPVWYRFPGENWRVGALMDVSRMGARLVTERMPDGPFEITLNLEHDHRLKGEAIPMWVRGAEDGTFMVGVQLRLKGPGRHLLGPWLQRHLKAQQPPRPRTTTWEMAGQAGRRWRTGRAWRKHPVPSSGSRAR